MEDYKKADKLRVERRFEEAYKGFKTFMHQIDTNNLNEYQSSQLLYINQAKDYIARLQPYLPKPKPETPPPAVQTKKGKKKKKS